MTTVPSLLSPTLLNRLQTLNPALDADWVDTVKAVFQCLPDAQALAVANTQLKAKSIVWDPKPNHFEYVGAKTLSALGHISYAPELKNMVSELEKATRHLQQLHKIERIADLIDRILDYIDSFKAQIDVTLHYQLHQVRNAFLYQTADWLNAYPFGLPSRNHRELNHAEIRQYFAQVYVKQMVQPYEFRSLSPKMLVHLPHRFLRQTIAAQAQLRQFELVDSKDFYFLIGNSHEYGQSPFSFRRFLHEDQPSGTHFLYLSHLVIDKHKLNDVTHQRHSLWCISRLFTLERKLSESAISFMDELDRLQHKYLYPILHKPLDQQQKRDDQVLKDTLSQYEKHLTTLILGKLPLGFMQLVHNTDDFDYVYQGVLRLMQDQVHQLQDFATRMAQYYSDEPFYMTLKVLCFLKFLEKNHSLLLELHQPKSRELDQKTRAPLQNLLDTIQTLQQQLTELTELKNTTVEQQVYHTAQSSGHFRKWFHKKVEIPTHSLEQLQMQIRAIHDQSFFAVIQTAKAHRQFVVYPEFECQMIPSPIVRHYSLPMGRFGLTQLPKLIELYEDRELMSTPQLLAVLQDDGLQQQVQWDAKRAI